MESGSKGLLAKFSYYSSVKAELKALLQDLWLAKDCRIKHLMIHMDSLVVS